MVRWRRQLRAISVAACSVVAVVDSASLAMAQTRVVATIKPIHSLVAQVMGDIGKPGLVVDGATSPHVYALKPSDAKLLNDATLVFRVSESLEPFTAKMIKSLPKSVRVATLENAPGLIRLPRRTGTTFEKLVVGKDSHGHSHTKSENGNGVDIDGHVWLDPANAIAMIDEIAATLAAVDASNAETYKVNAIKAKSAIETMAQEIDREMKPLAQLPYLVFHDAYQYFEARHGLSPVGSITTNPDVPPSGKRLADLRKKMLSLKATCVFAEPSYEARVVQAVIEGTGARTAKLDPEGTALPAGPDLYATLMRNLASRFKACLAPSG